MISILAPQVAALIAAGEVIHGPRDVLKELIENSLDAKATVIDIKLKYGGIEGICIADNGEGLSAEDLAKAPLRHATSKLCVADDLLTLQTFGFRGEGLYAISSVTNFSMSSRRECDAIGTKITVELPDRALVFQKQPMNIGTIVECNHLFAPIPVRRKLLKSPRIEGKKCLDLIRALLLVHPEVTVLVHERNELILSLFPCRGQFEDRLLQAFPFTKKGHWKHILHVFDQGSIEGWYYLDATKGLEQHWYINKRWFVQKNFLKLAQRYAQQGLLVIQISLKPEYIDVNLHPQKHNIGFYQQDSLMSSLSDFFLDWLGLPLPEEPVRVHYDMPASFHSIQQERPVHSANKKYTSSNNHFETHTSRTDLIQDLPMRDRSINTACQILFLEENHALLQTLDGLFFIQPSLLMRAISEKVDKIWLPETFDMQQSEHTRLFSDWGFCDAYGKISQLPAIFDRYVIFAWLAEDGKSILRLYQLLQSGIVIFLDKNIRAHGVCWLKEQQFYRATCCMANLLKEVAE